MFDTGVTAGDVDRGGEAVVSALAPSAAAFDAGSFDGGSFDGGLGDGGLGDVVVAGLIGFSARCRVAETVARARVVESVCEVAEVRLAAAEGSGGDPATVMRSVVCEVAVGLGVSQMVARPFVETGSVLDRLPLTALRFVFGSVDWARVVVIAQVLGRACDRTIRALESEAVAAAERLGPRSLRLALWALWAEFDAVEASVAKGAVVGAGRGVSVRQEGDGSSVLEARVSDIEGAEAEALVEEIVGTVCGGDPRSGRVLRADGLLALLHGEHALECRCDLGEQCPQFGVADGVDGRRGPVLQILIDVKTLLGLTSTPARLADGTPIDAGLARVIAEDARWQGLLMELVEALDARTAGENDGGCADTATATTAGTESTSTPTDSKRTGSAPTRNATRTPNPARPEQRPDQHRRTDESSASGSSASSGARSRADEPNGPQSSSTESSSTESSSTESSSTESSSTESSSTESSSTESSSTESSSTESSGTESSGTESSSTESNGADPAAAAERSESRVGTEPAGTAGGGIRVPRLLYRGRTRPPGTVPPQPKPQATQTPGAAAPGASSSPGHGSISEAARAQAIAALLAAIDRDPAAANGCNPDGHGGHSTPPAGALTYRPTAEIAARVRMTYRTCTHPGCEIPSTRCQLDHIVAFDHDNPTRGGWSIETNLHPACAGHHQLKTATLWTVAYLHGGAILWTSPSGNRSISLPELGCPTPPRTRRRGRRTADPEPDIHTPTWWEKHMPEGTPEPTAADQRAAATDAARTRIRLLRRRFREQRTIGKLRKNAEPPPF